MNLEMPVFGSAEFVIRRGSIEFLTKLDKKRIALIVDSVALGNRLTDIQSMLTEAGIENKILIDINREPYIQDLDQSIPAIQEYKPDCIVSIGGGSVMDAGKALWIFYEHPEMSWDDAFKYFRIPPLGKNATLVAVPTTSGTGSETTFVAVFTNGETKSKHLIMSREIIPNYAILDADLVDSLPTTVALHSGIDALTHAMEAAISVASSPMVSSVALAAVLDIFEWLPGSILSEEGSELRKQARERMHIAASMAGMCIANTCCSLAHAFDQPGPYFNIPHGLVCGIFLPYTTKYLLPNPYYTKLAERMGFSGNEFEKGKQLVLYLHDFMSRLGMPSSFKAAGIPREEFMEKLDDFVDLAEESISTKLSPRIPNRDEIIRIFLDAYEGSALY
jgi:alcohol dehydrogenase class IV